MRLLILFPSFFSFHLFFFLFCVVLFSVQSKLSVNKVLSAASTALEHGLIANASGTQNTDATASIVNSTSATATASNTSSQSNSTDDKQDTTDNTSQCTVKSNTVAPSTVQSPKLLQHQQQRDDGNGNGNSGSTQNNSSTVDSISSNSSSGGTNTNNTNNNNNNNSQGSSNSNSNSKTAQASTTLATTESKYSEPKNVDTSVVSEFAGDASSIRYRNLITINFSFVKINLIRWTYSFVFELFNWFLIDVRLTVCTCIIANYEQFFFWKKDEIKLTCAMISSVLKRRHRLIEL